MHFIFSLLYAPFIFILLKYYDIKIIASIVFIISFLWFIFLENKKEPSALFLLFYIFVAIFAFFSKAFIFLKTIPFLISLFFSMYILFSYVQKKSIILSFAEKFSKKPIGESEKVYIHKSTLFWFIVSAINTLIHLSFLLDTNLDFWLYYSSIGWYFLFLFAGIMQFLHRRYIFLKRENV